MSYQYILFDLDGTLTDSRVGITKSVQYALAKQQIIGESLTELEKFIGPPLLDSFMEFYGFDEATALQAIEAYREYFKIKGIFENEVYKGIPQLLADLSRRGAILAVATSKPTVFSEQIIEHFGLSDYFKIIVGSNLDGTRTNKGEVISCALDQLQVTELNSVVMIGDRKHDVLGAQQNQLASIGVLYGFGILAELSEAKPTYLVNSVTDLTEMLLTV